LTMTIVNFKKAESQLEQQVDDLLNTRIPEAKQKAQDLTKEEAQFFRDIPSIFNAMKDQLNRVVSIATISKTIQSASVHNDKIDEIIAKVALFQPFKEDDYTFMKDNVKKLDDLEKGTEEAQQKLKDMQAVFAVIAARIPNSQFIKGFKDGSQLYTDLEVLLKAAYDNFNIVSQQLTAINALKPLSDANTSMPVLKLVMQAMIPPSTTGQISEDEIVRMIALFTDYKGDTYPPSYNLKYIRDSTSSIDAAKLRKYIDDANAAKQKQEADEAKAAGTST